MARPSERPYRVMLARVQCHEHRCVDNIGDGVGDAGSALGSQRRGCRPKHRLVRTSMQPVAALTVE